MDCIGVSVIGSPFLGGVTTVKNLVYRGLDGVPYVFESSHVDIILRVHSLTLP